MVSTKGAPRRRLMELLVAVAVVHGVAITLYYLLDISEAAARTQRLFAWIWMGLTVVVVLVGQRRLRVARRAAARNDLRP